MNYKDTFSPVVKVTPMRILVSLATTYHWFLYQLDVKNAFLNDIFDDEFYMKQPLSFVTQGESEKVCRLKTSLHGLK